MVSVIRIVSEMSGRQVLLDSVILIDHFNGIQSATRYIGHVASRACISTVTRAEVLTGFDSVEARALARELLDRFPLIPIDTPVADLATELRHEHRWKLPDAFQAAVAKLHGLTLVTRNVKDFPPDRYAFVHVPYSLSK